MALEKIALEDDYFVEPQALSERRLLFGHRAAARIGIPVSLFTAIFALARTVGWIAQLERDDRRPRVSRSAARARLSFVGSPRARRAGRGSRCAEAGLQQAGAAGPGVRRASAGGGRQPAAEMLDHQARRSLGIAHDGRHQRAVLGQALGQPAPLEQRVVAVELHHLAQIERHLLGPAVARQPQQREVKALVGGEEGIAVAQLTLELLVQRTQLGAGAVARRARPPARAASLSSSASTW
jgi:hypothetical protein